MDSLRGYSKQVPVDYHANYFSKRRRGKSMLKKYDAISMSRRYIGGTWWVKCLRSKLRDSIVCHLKRYNLTFVEKRQGSRWLNSIRNRLPEAPIGGWV